MVILKRIFAFLLLLIVLLTSACAPADNAAATAATTVTTEALAEQGIKNIILVIGDGMGPQQVKAGELAASKSFVFTDWQHTFVNTNSLNGSGNSSNTTDSAAAATALATGTLTYNGHIATDITGAHLKTIMDYAREYGKATGVVTTDKIYGATPSAFSGHARSRDDYEEIMLSQFGSEINLLCSSFSADVLEKRKSAIGAGYVICDSYSEAKESLSSEYAYWLLNLSDHTAYDKLTKVTSLALDFLSKDPEGFVLMVEQANIDTYGHKNIFDGLPQCVNILNDTIATILEWAGDRDDTAILVTADHETGGLQISTQPEYEWIYSCADGSSIYYDFTTMTHTDTQVDLFAYGFNADFRKYYTEDSPNSIKNTSIFRIMLDLLENPIQENN